MCGTRNRRVPAVSWKVMRLRRSPPVFYGSLEREGTLATACERLSRSWHFRAIKLRMGR